jgi:hypothetical protein
MALTQLEAKLLNNIAFNLYTTSNGSKPESFDDVSGGVWTFAVGDGANCPSQIRPRSIPGVVSSLVKKGFVWTRWASGNGDEPAMGMTEAGWSAWKLYYDDRQRGISGGRVQRDEREAWEARRG